jgi:5-methylcytosine-specific restriction enzyme A
MPLRRKQLEVEDFEYVEAVCVERFSTFQADPVRRGQVYSLALARSEAPRILSLAWPSTRRTAAPGQVEHVMPLFSCASCGRTYPPPRRRGRCPTCARDYERRKGSAHERGYTKQHRENAARVIAAHPWCVDCGATDDLCADHIVPLSKGGTNRLNNYAVRCRGCKELVRTSSEGDKQRPLRGRCRIVNACLQDPATDFRETHSHGLALTERAEVTEAQRCLACERWLPTEIAGGVRRRPTRLSGFGLSSWLSGERGRAAEAAPPRLLRVHCEIDRQVATG